jgi:hypothetical protein
VKNSEDESREMVFTTSETLAMRILTHGPIIRPACFRTQFANSHNVFVAK